ncbi:hypothetical protein FisN_18Lh063 [Fistulifera solaris]|uniref:Uncharacterized protein n=1 Tax=Fistulifera solaris TaxID=1519565 RepID=A0A1Z5KEK4_FISSO|nr:hypothetical protein FisN_18Lh063 [Fistulifera solaris]|eukprot:GAX24511.1 hypothetical protein FisN_18Lh063 [Fistulifera solaris]
MGSKYLSLWLAIHWLSNVRCYVLTTRLSPIFIERNSNGGRGPLFSVVGPSSLDSENTSTLVKPSKQELLENLARDFAILAEARPPTPSADDSMSPVLVSAGSSYTRLWTHSTWQSHSRPPHIRYARHVLRWWSSSTARVILPAVLIATAYATVLCVLCRHLGWTGTMGRMVLHTRGLANILKIYLFDSNPYACTLAIRHMAAFPWVIKVALRGENSDRNLEVLKIMLGESSEDYEWAVAQNKLPVALTSRLRQLCSVALHQSPFVHAGVALMIEERIRELETVYGACQRIFTSPIPPTYSRHLSRVLTTWLLVTPMSLIASGLPTITVALTTTLGAYVLIGIDEVGMEIENAFALLPLQQLCGSAQNDIRDAFLTEMPTVGL